MGVLQEDSLNFRHPADPYEAGTGIIFILHSSNLDSKRVAHLLKVTQMANGGAEVNPVFKMRLMKSPRCCEAEMRSRQTQAVHPARSPDTYQVPGMR